MADWKYCQAQGNCTNCGQAIYVEFHAAVESGTDNPQVLFARYISVIHLPCSVCGHRLMPEGFDANFKPEPQRDTVYFAEGVKEMASWLGPSDDFKCIDVGDVDQ
jgi:hypothetical protein